MACELLKYGRHRVYPEMKRRIFCSLTLTRFSNTPALQIASISPPFTTFNGQEAI